MQEMLLVNLGRAVPQKMGGRDYLVAPLTLIVPGVLTGSQGPIYYPPEEVERWPGLWNHVPLVVYHPVENGQHVTARDPAVLDKSGIGLVLRDKYENDKRSAEAWFEVESTKRVDQTLPSSIRILPRLLSGAPIEISTGLDLDKEIAPVGATHNETPYESIARNFRPDHLAILPDAKGACSNKDGCGVNVNQEVQPLSINELFEMHLALNCGGEGGTPGPCPKGGGEGGGDEKKIESVGYATKGLISATFQRGEGDSLKTPGKLAAKAELKVIHKEMVSAGFEKQSSDSHSVKATKSGHSESFSGGGRKGETLYTHPDGRSATVSETYTDYRPATVTVRHLNKTLNKTFNGGDAMKRSEMITHLTTNCECWKGKGDGNILEKMKDDQLQKLVNQSKIILVVNQIKSKKSANADDEAVAGVPWTELAVLLGVDLNPADDPIAFAAALKSKVDEISSKLGGTPAAEEMIPEVTMQATEEEDQVAAAAGTQEVPKTTLNKKKGVIKPLSSADWLKGAPPEVRSAVTNAMNLEKQAKVKLVQRLVGNVADAPKRQAMGVKMMIKSLEELQELASLIPEVPVQNQDAPNFAFAGGAGVGQGIGLANEGGEDDSDNTLPTFAVNFEEMASPKLRQKTA